MKTRKHSSENEQPTDPIHAEETKTKSVNEETAQNPEETAENEAAKIAEDLVQVNQKCEELNDKNLRLMAEFDNFRKRTLREKADLIKTAGEKVFVNILPLIDDFERAIQAMDSTEDVLAVKEGVDLIYAKFISFLNANGVKAIATENEPFDVDVHEAVTMFPAPSEEMKGKIIDCLSKGYMLNDKVIRYAKVVVGE